MTRKEKIDFLKDLLLENNQLYTWEFDADFNLIDSNCEAKNTFKNLLLLDLSEDAKRQFDQSGIAFLYTNSLSLTWAILPLHDEGTDLLYALGPVFYQEFSSEMFKSRMDLKNMPISSQLNLMRLLPMIPVIQTANFMGFAGMFYFALCGKKVDLSTLVNVTGKIIDEKEKNTNFDVTTHGTYPYEQLMLQCVREGDLNHEAKLNAVRGYMANQIVGTMSSSDPLRQVKDSIIVQTALVTRAAIEGGMEPDAAYSLSDLFVQRIEACQNEGDVFQISSQMYATFVRQVHDVKSKDPVSAPIRQCCTWIQENIRTDISLEDMAKRMGYTPYYLSNRFKTEMGISINHYITEQKMTHAKFLLSSTTLSVSEISDMLCFSTPSYFASQFKKLVGKTPVQYRNVGASE